VGTNKKSTHIRVKSESKTINKDDLKRSQIRDSLVSRERVESFSKNYLEKWSFKWEWKDTNRNRLILELYDENNIYLVDFVI